MSGREVSDDTLATYFDFAKVGANGCEKVSVVPFSADTYALFYQREISEEDAQEILASAEYYQ